jgi:hypothetical protein
MLPAILIVGQVPRTTGAVTFSSSTPCGSAVSTVDAGERVSSRIGGPMVDAVAGVPWPGLQLRAVWFAAEEGLATPIPVDEF